MKKTLLSLAAAALSVGAFAQAIPSPFWNIIQNGNFNGTTPYAGVRFIDAVSSNDVWAIGYNGLAPNENYNWFSRTTNGGTTWTGGNVYADTNTYVMANLDAIDANTAWVSAYMKSTQNKGAAHQTTNGGTTWTNMTPAGGYTNNASFMNVVCFVTPSVGIIQGDPIGSPLEYEIYRTTDGGTSWTKVPGANIPNPLNPSEYGLVNVYTKHGANDIWFGTNNGRVYHSNDGGLNWTVGTITGAVVGVNELAFTDPNNGLAYAYSGTTTSPVLGLYRTTDGGATWTQVTPLDPNMGLNDVVAITGTSWFASAGAGTGNQIISYSTDHGATWNSWGGSNIQYLNLDFADNINAWAGSFADNLGVGGIFKFSGAPLGLNEVANAPRAFEVYPNPTSGKVKINLPVAKQGCDINVINVLGQVVRTAKASAVTTGETLTLDLSDLQKGVYFVNIVVGAEKHTQKIIVD